MFGSALKAARNLTQRTYASNTSSDESIKQEIARRSRFNVTDRWFEEHCNPTFNLMFSMTFAPKGVDVDDYEVRPEIFDDGVMSVMRHLDDNFMYAFHLEEDEPPLLLTVSQLGEIYYGATLWMADMGVTLEGVNRNVSTKVCELINSTKDNVGDIGALVSELFTTYLAEKVEMRLSPSHAFEEFFLEVLGLIAVDKETSLQIPGHGVASKITNFLETIHLIEGKKELLKHYLSTLPAEDGEN